MEFALSIALVAAIYFALKWGFGGRGKTAREPPNKYYLWAAIACGAAVIFGSPYFGSRVPGSPFERADYTGRFFVYMFPNAGNTLSYRVPAEVETYQSEDRNTGRGYWLRYAVMPNGGSVRFDECRLRLRQLTRCMDAENRHWAIRMTSDRATKKLAGR